MIHFIAVLFIFMTPVAGQSQIKIMSAEAPTMEACQIGVDLEKNKLMQIPGIVDVEGGCQAVSNHAEKAV